MAKKQTPEEKLIDLTEKLKERFARWETLYVNGGSDPFWSDGVNLNLVRNHISYYKKNILELCDNHLFFIPDEYDIPTPEEVSQDYMAKADDIIVGAQQSCKLLQSDVIAELSDIQEQIPPELKNIKKSYHARCLLTE